MGRSRRLAAIAGVLAGLGAVGAASRASAQAVMLPTQEIFSVGTTVVVPDGGAMYLGGVSRAREGSVSRGVPLLGGPLVQQRGYGREFSRSGASVHARIIDLDELDREVLAAARAARGEGVIAGEATSAAAGRAAAVGAPARPGLAEFLSRHMGRNQ